MRLRLQAAPLLLVLISLVACRADKDPPVQERAWGQAEPEDARQARGSDGKQPTDRDASSTSPEKQPTDRDASSTSTEKQPTNRDASSTSLPLDSLLAPLRPSSPPDPTYEKILRAGLDAIAALPPSSHRDALSLRLTVAWAGRDAAGAAALALALPRGQREDTLAALLPRLASPLDPVHLPALLHEADLDDAALRRVLARCALDLAADAHDVALACHGALGDHGDMSDRTAWDVARSLATTNPASARIWVDAIQAPDVRAEALAILFAGSEDIPGGLEAIEDEPLRDRALVQALTRLAATRPQAAMVAADEVADPALRAEVLEAAAWAWLHQGDPELALQALSGAPEGPALEPLLQAATRLQNLRTRQVDGTLAVPETATGTCDALGDPQLIGACLTERAAAAASRGDRDAVREGLQAIPDDAWRAAALAPLYGGLSPILAREWLRRSRALRDRLDPATRDRHLSALLARCDLPPAARLRDGLALLTGAAARRRLLTELGGALSAEEVTDALAQLANPGERALLCVTVLEQD